MSLFLRKRFNRIVWLSGHRDRSGNTLHPDRGADPTSYKEVQKGNWRGCSPPFACEPFFFRIYVLWALSLGCR